ncbi:RNA polymerase sigma factor [Affinirhizobium pseudoryzae]|jgi:RNA polymerase sigma-70 factor (ECF subfamily)|uniref:RNA polymerase sigma factor n=1 Tax=Allorhizobium pseudoryzae TaxID=379684 RepID=UPI0013E9CB9D|nr:RNA polymerase sigma factor [Allorhizobium pseudoryzae]
MIRREKIELHPLENESHSDPDADLLRRVAAGDEAAMRALVAAKLPRLLALSQRMLGDRAEAEDVAQETFFRIWKQAGRWQAGRAKFDTWAHRVALNLCYDRLRKRRDVMTDDLPEQVDPGPLPDAGLTEDGDSRRVELALQNLAPRQREAIILVYYQELSNREAASVMAVSVDALESLLSRGRRMLQSLLLGDGKDE